MKKLLLCLLICAFTHILWGEEKGKGNGACKSIKAACESAGFTKGGHKDGKGLFKDCLRPLMDGQSVSGVSVDATALASCKENKQKMKDRKHKRQEKRKERKEKSESAKEDAENEDSEDE